MLAPAQLTTLAGLSSGTIARRRQFAAQLQRDLELSAEQWAPLTQILALSQESALNMYACYPYLFNTAFPALPAATLDSLAWAGRCILDSILLADILLDSGQPPNAPILLASYAFQREYTRVLQELFPAASPLWEHLSRYEREAASALCDEAARRINPLLPATPDALERQACGKAALSRLALVALALLTERPANPALAALLRASDAYNTARQIQDDLRDWRADYAAGRYSLLLADTLRLAGVTEATQRADYPSAARIGAIIYRYQAAALLERGIALLNEAEALSAAHQASPIWLTVLTELRESLSQQRSTLAEVRQRQSRSARTAQPGPRTLDEHLAAAQAFLLERQEAAGCWRDFATAAGESSDWITGYVGYALGSSERLPAAAAAQASAWLAESQSASGGWGYHRATAPDSDSTAWCLRLLSQIDAAADARMRAVDWLQEQQQADGGIPTYAQPAAIRDWMGLPASTAMGGWSSAHPCVTAVAAAALAANGAARAAERAQAWLAAQAPNGLWRAYWWSGPLYATAHALELPGLAAHAAGALPWLLEQQAPDGSWGATPDQSNNAFATALALSMLAGRAQPHYQAAAERGAQWLLQQQAPDGGWASSALMLLPEPHEQQPWRITHWPIAIKGTGIARRDHRRLFTTATALAALARWQRLHAAQTAG